MEKDTFGMDGEGVNTGGFVSSYSNWCRKDSFGVNDVVIIGNLNHGTFLLMLNLWLNVYGLYEVKVSGDGNCQFRALSDQMYKSPEYHKYIRKEVVKQLKDCCALYEGYIPMKYKHYYKKMAKSGEWGDHVTLQAAADKFAAKICLLTSFRDTCFIEIMPQYQAPKRELWLSFWSEVHYNSLYDVQDAPIPPKPRRKHWLF